MKNFKNILWIIALLVVIVLLGVIGWGYYNEKRYNQAVHQLMPLAKNKDKVAHF